MHVGQRDGTRGDMCSVLYIVVITSIVNLILGSENTHLWIALLSSSLGYILPALKLGAI